MKIESGDRKGQVRFVNDHGMVLSVVWHEFAYCEKPGKGESPDVEIACWKNTEEGERGPLLQIRDTDTVRGWVPVAELCAIIGAWPNIADGDAAIKLCWGD